MNIIELAKDAGYQEGRPMARLERFAALVSEAGRAEALEEAAKVCDDYINRLHDMRDNDMSLPQYQPELAGRQAGAGRCAAAIRSLK